MAKKKNEQETTLDAALETMPEEQAAELEQAPEQASEPAGEPAAEPGKPGEVLVGGFAYQRKWYKPEEFHCPQCDGAVNATLLSRKGEVALACAGRSCGFSDTAWGSWAVAK